MDNRERIEIIESLIENYKLDEARDKLFNVLDIDNKNIEALILLGKIETKKQQYGDALNTYQKVLEIEKENEKAQTAIKMINNILEIRRSFYFENTYTDDDLYL
jgi:cytochrome c-type biogenesis protein CcmH/NrfG